MARLNPKVRAQCERARRPAVMFAIGMALAVPAGSFLLRQEAANTQHPTSAYALTSGNAAGYRATGSGVYRMVSLERTSPPPTNPVPPNPRTTIPHEARAQLTARLASLFGVPMGLAEQIHSAAEKEGISPRLAFGLVRTESRFKSTAVSPVGAIGLAQVMPKTGAWMRPGTKRSDLFDPGVNLSIGFKYLRGLIDQYNGDVRLALTAYNRGPGTVRKAMRRGRNPENGYADMVLKDPSQLKRPAVTYASTTKSQVTKSTVKSKANFKATNHSKHKVKASSQHRTHRQHARKFKRARVIHKTS
jgi:hypothetical protein